MRYMWMDTAEESMPAVKKDFGAAERVHMLVFKDVIIQKLLLTMLLESSGLDHVNAGFTDTAYKIKLIL